MRSNLNKDRELAHASQRLTDVLRTHGQRQTGERAQILSVIRKRAGSFTADEIADELRARGLRASRATVYRTLPLLVEAGIISPRLASGEEKRFEYTFGSAHHDHLVCQQCGRVVEFKFEAFEILQEAVAAKHGFKLVGHVHELFGICEACRAPEI